MDTTTFENTVDEVAGRLRPRLEDAKKQLGRLDGGLRAFVKDHPAACLLGAVALGYLVARVARRRS
jgi:hypothetical protein